MAAGVSHRLSKAQGWTGLTSRVQRNLTDLISMVMDVRVVLQTMLACGASVCRKAAAAFIIIHAGAGFNVVSVCCR